MTRLIFSFLSYFIPLHFCKKKCLDDDSQFKSHLIGKIFTMDVTWEIFSVYNFDFISFRISRNFFFLNNGRTDNDSFSGIFKFNEYGLKYLVNYSSHSESVKNQENSVSLLIRQSIAFQWLFKDSMRPEQFTNLDAKCSKRSVK